MIVQHLRGHTSRLTSIITSVIQYGCMAYCFSEYVADISICTGPSMEPTLINNDVVLSEHINPRRFHFNYGDIIISKSPTSPKEYICKRIIGLPGDKIKYNSRSQWVPVGHVWIEGDNRDNSTDSRDYGPVPQGLIKGRVICKIWPIKDVSMLTVRSQ